MTVATTTPVDSLPREFALSVQELSLSRLRKLAQQFNKNLHGHTTKDEIVNVLTTTMSREQKIAAMRDSILAGVTSLSVIRLPKGHATFSPQIDPAFQYATSTPRIVAVGESGLIIPSLQHISWAILAGHNAYVDSHLHLQIDERAMVIESFYDPATGLLQVRGSAYISQRVAREWAKLASLEESDIEIVGIQDREQFHAFAAKLSASVVKCTGELLESRGFDVVSARKHANFDNLLGTPDYDDFQKETAAIDGDIEFKHDGRTVKLGIGIASRSLVFRTYSRESTIQFVYGKLKEYLQL